MDVADAEQKQLDVLWDLSELAYNAGLSHLCRMWFMANTAQARKRARQTKKQNAHNAGLRSRFRSAVKSVKKAIQLGDKAKALGVFQSAQRVIDSIADKKILHKNKAARHKSRLSAAIKALPGDTAVAA
jgi:small subunit ribosomal protein S20